MDFSFRVAASQKDFADGRALFVAYSKSLSIDLGFQDFDQELHNITNQYNKPSGALLLVYQGEQAVACAAVRKLDDTTAELKRMYVDPQFRQNSIGKQLLGRCIEMAISLGYKKIRLDTLPDMLQALALYRAFGFYEIPAYRFNPVPGAVYMEKLLNIDR
jgi:ribosomal protein S18 acetylase RimI-like enzyme